MTAIASRDGILVAAVGRSGTTDRELVAISVTGEEIWRRPFQSDLYVDRMAVSAAGVWLAERNGDGSVGRIRHLDAGGVEIWSSDTDSGPIGFSMDPQSRIIAFAGSTGPNSTGAYMALTQYDANSGEVLSRDLLRIHNLPTSIAVAAQDDIWENSGGTLYEYKREP